MKILDKESQIKPEKISDLPKTPGVYIFYDKGKILYIGKASNLRERIKNHFNQPSYKDNLFIKEVEKVGTLPLSSEIEALIEEARLIKKYQPKFNVMFRDDKNYFFVGMTKEDWPGVFTTHQLNNKQLITNNKRKLKDKKKQKNKKLSVVSCKLLVDYIGPFTDGTALKEALKTLRRAIPYRSCKRLPKKPCLYYGLNLCPGPCLMERNFQRIPELKNQYLKLKREYQKQVQYLKEILEQGKEKVIRNLQKEMKEAAKKEEFEKAEKLKKSIESLKKVFLHRLILTDQKRAKKRNFGKLLKQALSLSKIPKRIEGYDISNIQEKEMVGSMVVFSPLYEGGKLWKYQPDKKWYRKFKIKSLKKQSDTGCLKEILKRRLFHPEWPFPDLIFIDGGKGQLNVAKKVWQEFGNKKTYFLSLAKRKNILYNNSPQTFLSLNKLTEEVKMLILNLRDEAHRFALSYHHCLRRKKYSLV